MDQPPKLPEAQVQIVYASSPPAEEIITPQKLYAGIQSNANIHFQRLQEVEALKSDIQECFKSIGALIEYLKKEEEEKKARTNAILTVVKRENTKQNNALQGLNTSMALQALKLDEIEDTLSDLQKAFSASHAVMDELKKNVENDEKKMNISKDFFDTKNQKIIELESNYEFLKQKVVEALATQSLLSDSQEYFMTSNKILSHDITAWKKYTMFFGVLSMANFAAICVAGWIWRQMYRA